TGLSAGDCSALLKGPVGEGSVVVLPTTPRRYLSGPAHREMVEGVRRLLETFHRKEPLQAGVSREEVRTRLFKDSHPEVFRALVSGLVENGTLRAERDRLALAGHRIATTPREGALMERIEARFASAGTNPPDLEAVVTEIGADPADARKLFHLLLSRGRLVRIHDGKVFHADALEDLKRRLWELRERQPLIDISDFKDLSGTSRKNAIPLLEHFDQARVTRREGNRRLILPPPAP
ncbi:MAG TPA: SelB C-terminal domain-containing protein, partial [Candidatus Polarisedimenticolia bacterium]|nr:SelB C-terminal domain-containing protein [Candidatus Polarisedimenticolia bacterium]